jgi:phosphohistidine phosphatase SixA
VLNLRLPMCDPMKILSSGFLRSTLAPVVGALTAMLLHPSSHATDEQIWKALRTGGHAVLIRHALAPGVGDPPGFKLGNCATQRNLSDEGRAQARAIGAAFRNAGIRVDAVLSSRWCRSYDTATLMDLGTVEPLEALDSFFRDPAKREPSTTALGAYLAELGNRTVLMVTHQVNITALTGVYPDSSEAVVVAPGDGNGVRVVGRLRF